MAADALVFLHGWTMRGAIFDEIIAQMPQDLPCYAPDLPGHGDCPDAEPALECAVTRLDAMLRDLGLTRVVLVGWSMGAAIAWRYIERFGDARLAGLITVDMSPRVACDPEWPHGLRGQDQTSVDQTTKRLKHDWRGTAEAIASTMFATRDGPNTFPREVALEQILSNRPSAMRRLWKDLAVMDLRKAIAGISVPYLASYGVQSRVYPETAAHWLAKTAPNAEVFAFAHSGHSPNLEEPEAFAQMLLDFLLDLDRSA